MFIEHKLKGIATLWLIIVGFVLIIGGGYWFWVDDIKPYLDAGKGAQIVVSNNEMSTESVPVDTTDWKTYRNEKYGFEVKYPENWKFTDLSDKYSKVWSLKGEAGSMIIQIQENPNKLSIRQWVDTKKWPFEDPNAYLEYYGLIGETEALISNANKKEMAFTSVFFTKNDKIFIVTDEGVPIELGKYQEIDKLLFDQILATFKFIESASESDTSAWKTYRNEKYGFELKYPVFGQVPKMEQNGEWLDFGHVSKRITLDNFSDTLSIRIFPAQLSETFVRWFDKNIDWNSYLSKNKIFQLRTLENGWLALEKIKPMPDEYVNEHGPICSTYISPPNEKYFIIFCFASSEANEIDYFGYNSREKKEGLYNQILSTFKFVDK